MAPAASITVECQRRASHGAVIVRLVHDAPTARPRTHTQSAHAATCAPIYKYRRSAPCHGRARAHTPARAHARTQTCTHTNAQDAHTHVSTIAQRAQADDVASTRAQIRTARICSRAHGPYRRVGSARTSAAESAAGSRLPIACAHARTDASSISYAIRRCGGAQEPATAAMAPLPIAPRHISADLRAHRRAHIRVHPPMDQYIYAHTHGVCSRVCASGVGDARRGMQGGCGVDLRASAGTQSPAQQSRAAPRGRLVAFERAAEPRRPPSLVRRRFLPRPRPWRIRRRCCAKPQSAALPGALRRRGRSANRPKGESALVGNVQAASGPGYAAECVRAWEGRNGRQGGGADDTGRRRPESPTSAAPPAAAAGGGRTWLRCALVRIGARLGFRAHAKVRWRYNGVAWRRGICSAVIGSAAQRGQVRAAAEHTRMLYVLARGTGSTHTCGERRCARVVHRIGRRRRRRRCRRACSLASGRPRTRGCAHGKACTRMSTRGAWLHTSTHMRHLGYSECARGDCEYSFTLGSRAASSRRGPSYARWVLAVLVLL